MTTLPSLPESFVSRMREQLGNEWDDFRESLSTPPTVSIRWNPLKSDPAVPMNFGVPWCTQAEYLDTRISFTLDPRFHAGAYYVQESSSMFIEQCMKAANFNDPVRVLDLCAAPGGKSTHLLDLIPVGSLLVSNEPIRNRLSALSENIIKWGHANVMVTNNDPRDFSRLKGFFDVVVVDAPCSGEGLFRKNTSAVEAWSPAHVAHCTIRQQRILLSAWETLREDGILIYSTCTFNRSENEQNMEWLQQQKPFESIDIKVPDNWGVVKEKAGSLIGYRFYPHRTPGEGFFITAVRKKERIEDQDWSDDRQFTPSKKEIEKVLRAWLRNDQHVSLITEGRKVFAVPSALEPAMSAVSELLNVVQTGTAIATLKTGRPVPEHALALSPLAGDHFPLVIVEEATALQYLRKESLPSTDAARGYARIVFDQWPLGWVHRVGSRMNNLYPKNQRIRMR